MPKLTTEQMRAALAANKLTKTGHYAEGGTVTPIGATHDTAQEGPFLRIRPRNIGPNEARPTGLLEEGGQGTAHTPGSPRDTTTEPYSDEQIQGLVRSGNAFTHQAAQKYTQEYLGRPHQPIPNLPSSLRKQAPIGRAFALAASGDPEYKRRTYEQYKQQMPQHVGDAKDYDELLNKAYGQLGHETQAQFNSLPVNMSFHKNGEGNYSSSKQMMNDIYNNHHMYVYQGGDPHEHLYKVDPETGLSQNDMFRAVHDFYGHALNGSTFGPHGEEKAWAEHSGMFTPLARMALTAETRGQNSFVNYTPINAELKRDVAKHEEAAYEARRRNLPDDEARHLQNKKDLMSHFQFAPQKSVLLPPEMVSGAYEGGVPAYLRDLIKPEQGVSAKLTHFSHEPSMTQTDPTMYGTGIKGEEATRLAEPDAVRARTHFYVGEPRQKEANLGVNKYTAHVTNLYDPQQDPARLLTLAQEANRNPSTARANPGVVNQSKAYSDMERLAKEHGYNGVINQNANLPTAAVFGPTQVKKET